MIAAMEEPALTFSMTTTKTGKPILSFVDLAGQTHYIQASDKSKTPAFWLGSSKAMLLSLDQMGDLSDKLNDIINVQAVRSMDEPPSPDDFELDALAAEVWPDDIKDA